MTDAVSALFKRLITEAGDKPSLSLQRILQHTHTTGIGLLLVLIAAPAALPVPAVGYGTLLAIPLLLIASQIAAGRTSLWLPKRLANKQISTALLTSTEQKLAPWMARYERLSRPRLLWLSASSLGIRLTGVACVLAACFVALPFPLTNTVPSMGIVVMGLGLLERDGLAILAGILISLIGMALAIAAYILGLEALKALLSLG